MPGLSRRSELIPFSPIRTMFRLADEMERAGGGPVYRLHVGDPDFHPPAAVVDGVCDAMRGGKTHYEHTVGLHELRAAYAEKARARNGLAATTEHVVVTPGSTQALFASMSLMLGPGDEMMLPEIYLPNYIQQVLMLGARPRFYPLGAGYQPDLEETRRAVTDRTRAILINSPSNPTGAVFHEKTLRALYDLARERDLWVLSDEAYEDFVYGGAHVSPASFERDLPEEQRRVFTLFTFSKSYAMTGLRLGVIITPSGRVTTMLRKCQEPLVASGNSPTQWGACAPSRRPNRRGSRRCTRSTAAPRPRALDSPARGNGDDVPEGAFYIMADVSSTGMSGDEYAVALLREERVAVAPGAGFALGAGVREGRDAPERADLVGRAGVRHQPEGASEGSDRVLRLGQTARRGPPPHGALHRASPREGRGTRGRALGASGARCPTFGLQVRKLLDRGSRPFHPAPVSAPPPRSAPGEGPPIRSTASHRFAAASESGIIRSSNVSSPAASITGSARLTPMMGTWPRRNTSYATRFRACRFLSRSARVFVPPVYGPDTMTQSGPGVASFVLTSTFHSWSASPRPGAARCGTRRGPRWRG